MTLAPVAAIASPTELKTGTPARSNSTTCPPLPGVTPPTIRVPEVNMRWVCLRPSEPVMPWTMTLESEFRKIAIFPPALQLAASSAARRAAPSIVSTCSSPGRFAADRI